jgi:trehalose/maltose hydrolase-like predicted phosphorylase
VVYYTSRDTSQPLNAARKHLAELPNPAWDSLWRLHQENWEKEWQACDVEIEGDPEAQIAVRFSLFQLLIAAPRQDEHVSIGAKTLSGYGYRGHAFWDTEIFMLPFFTYTQPGIARNLLSYRYHNLDGARRKARANGFEGAQYPWESAATGDEVTPTWVPHFADRTKMVRIWTGDIEIHISAMICYALCQYWKATGDDDFILHRGAEIFFEVARFWASRAEWNKEHSRYEFHDVIGPDEYHDHVDNNAFTNAFARWTLQNAIRLHSWLIQNHPDIAATYRKKLHLMPEELQRWQDIAEKIYFSYDPQTGLIEQFDGYFQRRDVDLQALEPRSESIQAIFGIEGANLTQVLKQPDVLMLAYLLPELFDERSLQANYDYYTPRTDHTFGSSLGPSIQAIMACRLGKQEDAYEHFMRAARADLRDVRGNASDGIHGASAGGVWQAVVFGFGGLHIDEHGWHIEPRLPAHWKRLKFHFTWRGHTFLIDLPEHGPFSSEGVR